MEKGKKKKEEEREVKIDFGIGELSLGGLFKGIGSLIDQVSKLSEEAKEIKKTGEIEIKGLGEKVKGVYGFSVRTLAGEPIVETFGNIRKTPKGPVVEEVREPLVDVFDEKDNIFVVAELPGIEQKEIHTEIKGDLLIISAEGKERKYRKEVLLPCVVDESSLTSSYKNGVLEIKLKKTRS